MAEHATCQSSDRDAPRLACGHPLPCPYHTVIIEDRQVLQPKDRILNRRQFTRLKDIAGVV